MYEIQTAQQSVHTFATLRQVGVGAIYKQFPGFEFFLLPSRVHARPTATTLKGATRTQIVRPLNGLSAF